MPPVGGGLLSRPRAQALLGRGKNHQSASGWQFRDDGTGLERVCHKESWPDAHERDSWALVAQLETGLRTILRISSNLGCSRAHRFGQNSSLHQRKSFFFLVWFLSSRDNPFYLVRQLNCFHFFFEFRNKSANPAGLQPRALASCIDTEVW